jgi:hypothetical protein
MNPCVCVCDDCAGLEIKTEGVWPSGEEIKKKARQYERDAKEKNAEEEKPKAMDYVDDGMHMCGLCRVCVCV